ncbi:hypothetical protein M433DRAFT_10716 [Acidomyces richmondensis BFW]|nr:hypothetical protein M433DRAFT_10716 [Acidomyces richmondensis BFW]
MRFRAAAGFLWPYSQQVLVMQGIQLLSTALSILLVSSLQHLKGSAYARGLELVKGVQLFGVAESALLENTLSQ